MYFFLLVIAFSHYCIFAYAYSVLLRWTHSSSGSDAYSFAAKVDAATSCIWCAANYAAWSVHFLLSQTLVSRDLLHVDSRRNVVYATLLRSVLGMKVGHRRGRSTSLQTQSV